MNRIIVDMEKRHLSVLTNRQTGYEDEMTLASLRSFQFSIQMTTDIPPNATWLLMDFENDTVSYRLPGEGENLVHLLRDACIKGRHEEFWSLLHYQEVSLQELMDAIEALMNSQEEPKTDGNITYLPPR